MNLTDLFSAQFENAFKYQQYSNAIKIVGFILNLLLISVSLYDQQALETTFAVCAILLTSILIMYFDYEYMRKSLEEHEKGEKIRKIHLIDFIFGSRIEDSELEYLLLDIQKSVKDRAEERRMERVKKGGKDSSINFSNSETEQKARIITFIQQNCFETAQYLSIYYRELNKKFKINLIASGIIVFLICVVLISFHFSSFSSTQLIIVAFNFLFALNIFQYIQRCKGKAQQLKALDKTLQLIKKNAEFSDIIYYFSEYNSILLDKPLYPERIYRENCAEVEKRWKRESSKEHLV